MERKRNKLTTALALLLLPGVVSAQDAQKPMSAADLRAIDSAQEAYKGFENRKGEIDFEKAQEAAAQSNLEFNKKVQPALVGALRDESEKGGGTRFEAGDRRFMAELGIKEKYFLFVSSSMPMATLQSYADQCHALALHKKALVVMVIQGFIGGMDKILPTVTWVKNVLYGGAGLSEEEQNAKLAGIEINGRKAKDVKLQVVPALVSADGKCLVTGDASLESLITHVKENRCDRLGMTYELAEKNALDEIGERAAGFDQTRFQAQLKNRMDSELANLPGAGALPGAERNEQFSLEIEYELPFEVPNPEKPGEVLYPEGFRYKPLDGLLIPVSFVMFDGTNPDELHWVKAQSESGGAVGGQAKLLTLGGNYGELTRFFNRAVFRGDMLLEKNWCRATPCVVSFIPGNPRLQISQFKVEKTKKEKVAR